MKFWAAYCKALGEIWLMVTGILILVGIAGVWMREGFSGVQDLLSPSNVVNYIAMVIALIPGIVLLKLSKSLQRKAQTRK